MKTVKNLLLLLSGVVIGVMLFKFIPTDLKPKDMAGNDAESVNVNDNVPLYWVAPMDPNFKSDSPGLSPMGMPLVAVYNENGIVRISPDVVNNMGVRTTRVKKELLQSQIKTVGYVQYDEDKLIHVHPRVEGWIERLFVKTSGDPVKRGQALYTIYSPALVNAQEEYLIALKRKNERLVQAAEDRLRALQIPTSVIRDLKKTRQIKPSTTFYAPQSGVITKLNIREGFFVKPATSMMSIGVLNNVWVQAEIFERQSPQVKVGQPVVMTLAYIPGREWLGKVDYIYPTLDPMTRTLRVRLRFANEDHALMPNMFAQVVIQAENELPTLLLPKEAVIRTGDMNRVVLALDDGLFKSVAVEIGRSDSQHIELISGINEGERVVTSAQFLIDSESSKTSDFKRMSHADDSNQHVRVNATINHFIHEHHLINISHQPIDEWRRPAMTMNFKMAESVDVSMLEEGMVVNLQISSNENGELLVSDIQANRHGDMSEVGHDQGSNP
jgi:membrane fusion protein, copper/silver efflux system